MQGPLTIGVLRSKKTPGAQDYEDIPKLEPAMQFGLHEAFTQAFSDDAHFVCYYATGLAPASATFQPAPLTRWPHDNEREACPRLRKASLYRLRLRGAEVLCWGIALDFDNPDHAPWTPEMREAWNAMWLKQVIRENPFFNNYAYYYTTRGGARVIYLYDRPVKADEHEGKVRWFIKQFQAMGFDNVDTACWDWTRLFRLPYVHRDGYPTWGNPLCPLHVDYRPDNVINGESVPVIQREQQNLSVAVRPFTDPQPDEQSTKTLLHTYDGKNFKQTDWLKQAKKRLRGRECYDVLFNDAPLAVPGERTNSLVRMVGSAVAMLYTTPGTTPSHIYGLFLEAVDRLTPDAGTPDWRAELWTTIGNLWSHEEAKNLEGELKDAAKAAETLDIAQKLTDGMRKWMDHYNPGVMPTDGAQAIKFMSEHAIGMIDSRLLVISPEGGFYPLQLTEKQLIPFLREQGIDEVIPVRDAAGKYLPTAEILNKHGTVIHALRQEPQAASGYIQRIGSSDSTMHFCPFRRNDMIEPEPSAEVDEWLQHFFGQNYYEGIEWLQWAIAFDEGPICALSLKSDEGCGKDMLVQGLAETLRLPSVATADDLVTQWQYGMLSSPYLHVNEGWPRSRGGKHESEIFREVVGGGDRPANQKGKAPVIISNPMRVLMTANNMHVVRRMVEGRELTKEDQRAIAIRIKHFDIGNGGSRYLKSRGGLRYTGAEGKRWVRGVSGERSDYILAKHLLWLYEQRGDRCKQGSRFLVEGNFDRTIMLELRTGSGITPFVIEALLGVIQQLQYHNTDHVLVHNHRLFVTLKSVQEYMREEMSGRLKTAQPQQIKDVLLSLSPEEDFVSPFGNRRRYYEIDTNMLADNAREIGINSDTLNAMNAARIRNQDITTQLRREAMGIASRT